MHKLISLVLLPLVLSAPAALGQQAGGEDENVTSALANADLAAEEDQADEAAPAAASGPGEEAADCRTACLTYGLTVKLQSDVALSARPSSDTGSDTGLTSDLELGFDATGNLTFAGVITAETVSDWEPGTDSALRDMGIFVAALYAEYATDPLTLRAGKFDPRFGLGSDQLDLISAAGLSDAYDTEERLGLEATLSFPGDLISHAVTGSLFTTDRTLLSRSLGTDRGQQSLSDGGAGNVTGLGSAALYYDLCSGGRVETCFIEGDFGARLGVRYQKAGRATQDDIEDDITPHDEIGYLGAATARLPLAGEQKVRLLGEVAYFRHFEGSPDNALIGTGSVAFDIGPVAYAGTYSVQRNFLTDGSDTTDRVLGLAARYDLDESGVFQGQDWTLDAGYSFARRGDGTAENKIGVSLTVAFGGMQAFR